MEAKRNKLSIIIPCFNCQATLVEAVESCYKQGFKEREFEIIMVNDKSTDDTLSLIRRLAQKYSNIKYLSHEINKGGGATRNTAVSQATSDVIFCLDSDDILPEGTLVKMYSFLKEKNCDGVAFNFSVKFNNLDHNDIVYVDEFYYEGWKIPFESLLADGKTICPLYVNFMYTKMAWTRAGKYPENHGSDTPGFAWRFLCANLTAYICPNSKYLHRINYTESYFLREYNKGMMNFNWQKIFLENYFIFTDDAINFIIRFDCKDFTKNINSELLKFGNVLTPNYRDLLGTKHQPLKLEFAEQNPINRDSLIGYILRIKYKVIIFTKMIINTLIKISRKIIRHLYSIPISLNCIMISRRGFNSIYLKMRAQYISNKDNYDINKFLMPQWEMNTKMIEDYFLNHFSFGFLNNALIKTTMFVYSPNHWRKTQIKFIEANLDKEKVKNILKEYSVGHPLLNDIKYVSSGNNIHHLYHLLKFGKEMNVDVFNIKNVIEVGGGYGNMAKIFKNINKNITYTIIDIPIFSYIQATYLKSIFGDESVNIVGINNVHIKSGLINIIPLDEDIIRKISTNISNAELLISTWALSEANKNMQDYLKYLDYFESKYLLFAYQNKNNGFKYSEEITNIPDTYNTVYNKETDYLVENYYLFCKRK